MATDSTIYRDMRGGYALPVSLAKNIRRLRRALNISQTVVGESLGVGQAAVSRWEKGKTLPDATMLPKLAVIVGATLDELLEGEEADYDASVDHARKGGKERVLESAPGDRRSTEERNQRDAALSERLAATAKELMDASVELQTHGRKGRRDRRPKDRSRQAGS